MFIDEKLLHIQAGKGGDGVVLFRREKYVPRGGPDGGDGGRGGDVILVGDESLNTLAHLAYTDRIVAEDGDNGGHKRSSGRSGQDALLRLPLGTTIFINNSPDNHHASQEEMEWQMWREILEPSQTACLAKGGNGGWGNWHFRSSINQAPERANSGQAGETYNIKLVLKLIADVGLVGLPNAGKSTLLAAVSAAKPKIANYPFTTLEPQLGVVKSPYPNDERTLVMADLPGLIEGAHTGKGLGTEFLKHTERTRALLHCLDISQGATAAWANYQTVRSEISSWSEALAQKPEIIALTKSDLLEADLLIDQTQEFQRRCSQNVTIIPVSAATKHNLDTLIKALLRIIDAAN